jgi:tetratricopeptide (TPR) repeat protein
MGVVYLAEQEEPVRRRVALKVIKLGMDTRSVIARFEAERQALALMDHPNIARVLDAGATDAGRPYFVMELVRGRRITEYCDREHLPTRQRLELFIQVCRAIQHAHQKGVIHRDIKPSNILITLHDGVPVPKVIDFGIAKATSDQRLTDKTLFTALEQFIGTPAYMSPEQAEMSGLDIDTRSDIYGLGVLLYELLTGRTPFDAQELLRAGLDEMRRKIREDEPRKPSTRLSTLGMADAQEVTNRFGMPSQRLAALVRGDLDWIVMKALEKDRTRRYETVNGLAMDIQRHLANEPVVARPPSATYRFQKLVRRNKIAVAAVTAVGAALVIGLGVSTWLLLLERRALRRAIAAEGKATTEAAKSQQVAQFLKEMLAGVGPSRALGRDTRMLREILDKTAARIGVELTNQPAVEAETRLILGRTYIDLGEYTNALAMTEEALRLGRACFGPKHITVAEALNNLGVIRSEMGDLAGAEANDRAALVMKQELLGEEDANVAVSLNNLGLRLNSRGDLAGAEPLHEEALRIRRKLLSPDHPDIGKSLNNLAMVLWARGEFARAESLFREALAVFRRAPEAADSPLVATMLNNVGTVLRDLGRLDEAETMKRDALAMRQRLLGNRQSYAVYSLNELALVLQRRGKLDEAERLHRNALAWHREGLGTNHFYYAEALSGLALVLATQGELATAEAMQRDAVATTERALGKEHVDTAGSLNQLAILLAARGDLGGAEALLTNALAIARMAAGADHPDTIPSLWHLAWVRQRRGDPDAAESLRREAIALSVKGGDYGVRALTDSSYDLADVLQGQRRFAEAEPLLLDAFACLEKTPSAGQLFQRAALERLVRLYETWEPAAPIAGKAAQAAHWKKRLEELGPDAAEPRSAVETWN